MISRRTTLLISNMVCDKFTTKTYSPYDLPSSYSDGDAECLVDANNLRDFLFEFNVDGYTIDYLCLDYLTKESLKEYILNMHTGRFYSTQNYKENEIRGQEDLKNIAIGLISKRIGGNNVEKLENLLRIDGYIYEKEHLYEINNDIDDKTDIIKVLYQKINLSEYNEFCTFYNYINEHISKEKWEDSISNCRKITEIVLKESALYYSKKIKKDDAEIDYKKPVKVREYLEKTAFFSEDEANIVHYFYKYMSNLGSHPEIALEEQAHFSRVMAVNIVLYTLKKLASYVTK